MTTSTQFQLTGSVRIIDENNNQVAARSYTEAVPITKYIEQLLVVPNSTTNLAVPFGSITNVNNIYVETDRAISIKLNSTSNTPIPVRTVALITADATTALFISNSSGFVANVKIVVG